MIDANVSGAALVIDPNAVEGALNTGTLQASGGGILSLTGNGSGGFNNSNGTIRALDGSAVYFVSNAVVEGGMLETEGSGTIGMPPNGSGLFRNLELAGQGLVENRATLRLSGAITIASGGDIRVEAGANGTDVTITDEVTLAGGGSISLAGSGNARILGSGTLTVSGGVIRGHGNAGNNGVSFVNRTGGTVDADIAEKTLTIDPAATETGLTNMGTLQASNGGTFSFTGNGGGGLDNTGGTVRALDGSAVRLIANAAVFGGLLTTEGSGQIIADAGDNVSLQDLSTTGHVLVENRANLRLFGNIDNKGTIRVEAGANGTDLSPEGEVTLSGGGTAILSGGNARILGNGTFTQRNHTIEGQGNFGNNGVAIVNDAGAVIHANVEGATLSLDPSSGGNLVNNGTIRASNGGTLLLNTNGGGNFTVGEQGVMEALSGGTLTFNGRGNITNITGGTLTNGTWRAVSGAQPALINLPGDGITTNAATIVLDGAAASIPSVGVLEENNGPLTVTNGNTFTTNASLTNRSTITAGQGGTIATDGSFTQEPSAGLSVTISGRPAETSGWGRIVAAANAALAGQLELIFNGGTDFLMVPGDSWKIVRSAAGASRTGEFTGVTLIPGPHRPANSRLAIGYLDDGVEIRFERNPGMTTGARLWPRSSRRWCPRSRSGGRHRLKSSGIRARYEP